VWLAPSGSRVQSPACPLPSPQEPLRQGGAADAATPQTMSYIHAEGAGGPDVLRLVTGPVPVPKPDEVLTPVLAAGVNQPDITQDFAAEAKTRTEGRGVERPKTR
jgi:hypothetical protein